MLVEGWLARAARARPGHVAVQTPAGSCSYAELQRAASCAADALERRGVRAGDRVAIALPGGLAFVQALHSCLLLGAVAVPVDPRLTERERARICEATALVLDEPLPAEPDRARAGITAATRPLSRQRPQGHDLAATAVVLHTSGTSAAPRAVELTYGNFLWSALGSAVALGLDRDERWLCALPISHVAGLSVLLRSAIYATTAVVHERFEVERVLQALREQPITLASLVATTLERLLDAGLSAPPRLRCALAGGGPVPAALVARAHSRAVPVAVTYGLTEACSQVTTTPAAELRGQPARPGPPLFCTRVQIAAQANASEEDGEILIRGPTVAPGALAPDGWLHSGDLGWLDEERRLHVRGRLLDTIISGGENVAPAEVEAVLERHPDVVEAAVVGRPDPGWGEAVTAFVVARAGSGLDAQALRAHCTGKLAPFKVPRRIVLRREPLPRTSSGKLLRRELP